MVRRNRMSRKAKLFYQACAALVVGVILVTWYENLGTFQCNPIACEVKQKVALQGHFLGKMVHLDLLLRSADTKEMRAQQELVRFTIRKVVTNTRPTDWETEMGQKIYGLQLEQNLTELLGDPVTVEYLEVEVKGAE